MIRTDDSSQIKVAVVGACASGKSTLVAALKEAGYEARHVAQEHSYVPAMWQRISQPDVLIYLDLDFDTLTARRPWLDFSRKDLAEQNRRLEHARQHCHLYINTNQFNPDEVRSQALSYLREYASAKLPDDAS